MKNRGVSFTLYGVRFESYPMTAETASEMVRQLRDRQISDVWTEERREPQGGER